LEYPFLRIAHATLRDSDISLVNGNLYALPFPDDTFDKIILSEVLEHLEDDVRGLREIVRVLKPGGLVAITVPNENYPFWWDPLNKTLETLFDAPIRRGLLAGIWANHVRLYGREGLRLVAEEAGLEVLAERSFTHYCMPFTHNIVYGFGKTILEAGVLPGQMAAVADRHHLGEENGSALNPVKIGLRLLEFFDRRNVMDEPPERSTVNLCLKGRKPHV
jgi:SAM-dependent methyltransferase